MGWQEYLGGKLQMPTPAAGDPARPVTGEDTQEAMWQKTLDASIEQRVRQYLEEANVPDPKAKNLSPNEPYLTWDPSTYGDIKPNGFGNAVSYTALRHMYEVPVIRNIIDTRLVQLMDFCYRQRHKGQPGFRVVMRDYKRPPTAAAVKRAAELEAWIETCGDPTAQIDPSFPTFVWKVMCDSMVYDQGVWEILHGRDGRPAAMIPVDAKTIRLAQLSNGEVDKLQRNIRKGRYTQVFPTSGGATMRGDGPSWDSNHMMFGIRRPSTAAERMGYGNPELEGMLQTVSRLLQAEGFNSSNFTNGVHAAAMLIIKAGMSREQYQSVDKQMRQMMSGASNAHRLVMAQLKPDKDESVQYIPFSGNNKDMEFSMWISWLLKIVCAGFQMDPAEINYVYGNEGQKSALGDTDPTERIASSRERGLKPLLRSLENWLNTSIIWRLDDDFRLEFVGLSNRAPLIEADLRIKSLSWKSVNEVRALDDDEPVNHWSCNVPANPLIFNAISEEIKLRQAQQQQAAQAGQVPTGAADGGAGDTAAYDADLENLPEELPDDTFGAKGVRSLVDEEDPSRGTPGFEDMLPEDMEKAMHTVSRIYGLDGRPMVNVADMWGGR